MKNVRVIESVRVMNEREGNVEKGKIEIESQGSGEVPTVCSVHKQIK